MRKMASGLQNSPMGQGERQCVIAYADESREASRA
jgi:hypothetical protein